MLKVWFVTVKKSFLSVLDMVTDVLMIVEYLNTEGQERFGRVLIAMVALCVLGQLFCVWVQNSKGPRSSLIREVLFTLLALKPGVDAFRVANGEEQAPYAVVHPSFELALTKWFEMMFEAIPGCVMQLYVILSSLQRRDDVSKLAYLSLVVSALSTGYSVSARARREESERQEVARARFAPRPLPCRSPKTSPSHPPSTVRHHHVGLRHRRPKPERIAPVLRLHPHRHSWGHRVRVHGAEQRHPADGTQRKHGPAHARWARVRLSLRAG
jgi:hypothetical protein